MILIAGGTGTLGTRVVRLLTARRLPVRILTRDPARARHLEGGLVEVVSGDVRDRRAVERATAGAETVVSAIHGFGGTGDDYPINFVSVSDVARFVELAVVDPASRGQVVEVGGPDNLTMMQFVQTFEAVTGQAGAIRHVPRPLMRAMAVLMRPVNPMLARQIQAGVVMDTRDMSFDPSDTSRRYPSIASTRLAEVVRCEYPGYTRAPLRVS